MTDKEFNLSDEYAAECVHLPPQEEVGDSKMYTSESIGNLEDANWNKQKWHYN